MQRHLSIFSSRYWAAWGRESASLRFGLLWVVLNLLVSLGGSLWLLNFGHTAHRFSPVNTSGLIHTLILGDSTEGAALIDEHFSQPSLNLSIGGSGYSVWKPVAEAWLNPKSSIKNLILSADALSLGRDGYLERSHKALEYDLRDLVFRGVSSFDLPVSTAAQTKHFFRFESFLSPAIIGPKYDHRYFQPQLRGAFSGYTFPSENGAEKYREYQRMVLNHRAQTKNIKALRQIMERARHSNIDLVLVRTPVTPEFADEGHEEDINIFLKISTLADEVMGPGNWRLFDGVGFSKKHEDFDDPNHVNIDLAKRFSRSVDAFLRGDERSVQFAHE